MPQLLLSIIILVVSLNLLISIQTHQILKVTKGVGMWSASIYDLADYLEQEKKPVICLDWGFYLNLLTLSKGEIEISNKWVDFLYPQEDSAGMKNLLLTNKNSLFIFHAPPYSGVLAITTEDYPRKTFFEVAGKLGLTVRLEKTFIQGLGNPIYEVYSLQDIRPSIR